MNREDIQHYLSNPSALDGKSGMEVKEMIGKYPYCSVLYLLLARSQKNEGSPGFREVIEKAAAYSPDREGLYFFLHASPPQEVSSSPDGPAPAQESASIATEPSAATELAAAAEAPAPPAAAAEPAAAAPEEELNLAGEEPAAGAEPHAAAAEASAPPTAAAEPASAAAEPAPAAAAGETAPPAGAETGLEKKATGPRDIALNIDDQLPRTFTVWLRRIRQVTEGDPGQEVKVPDILEKNYYRELITRNTEKEYVDKAIVKFDLEKKEDRIIARFIEEDPQVIKPAMSIRVREQPPEESGGQEEEEEVISETLARIYIDQELTDKAIRVYEKLSLKFPEKSAYFAGLIEKLKK